LPDSCTTLDLVHNRIFMSMWVLSAGGRGLHLILFSGILGAFVLERLVGKYGRRR